MNFLTMKILIAGLSVIVPTGSGEVTVLLPRVEHDYWQARGYEIPTHDAFLGYICDQWTGIPESRVLKSKSSGVTLCWLKLERKEVSVSGARARRPEEAPRLRRLFAPKLPDPDEPEQLQAIDWIPDLSQFDARHSNIEPSCMGRDPHELVQARATFEYTQQQACQFEGKANADSVDVELYEFRTEFGSPKKRQAMAAGAQYTLEIPHGDGVNPNLKIFFRNLDSGTKVDTLSLSAGAIEPIEIALMQFIPDKAAILIPGGRHHLHFRVYYDLADTFPEDDLLVLPHPTGEIKKISVDKLEASCRSKFLGEPPNITVLRETSTETLREICRSFPNLQLCANPAGSVNEFLAQYQSTQRIIFISPISYQLSAVGPPLCTPGVMTLPTGE